jgi:AraC-like DNA-binding protein/mannose-6-phosphate isomerase-like protein (cupin superfamily)
MAGMSHERFEHAVVAYANYKQFVVGERISFPKVRSRMVLWCLEGRGQVTVNRERFDFEPGRYLVLPWNHAVRYQPADVDPFLLAGVHVVPWHDPAAPVLFTVAHDDRHELADSKSRRDVTITEMAGVRAVWLKPQSPLTHLLEFITQQFIAEVVTEWSARQSAQLLMAELVRGDRAAPAVPPELQRLQRFITDHLGRPMSLSDLTAFSSLSASTVGRLFRAHLKMTPVSWILQTKMQRAKTLLRTTRLSVSEVGRRVGIEDPYYFSKCFKHETGQSPRAYRVGSAGF